MPTRKHHRARSRAAPPEAAAADERTGAARTAVLIFLGLLALYCSNLRVLAAGDSFPTRVLPFSILREGNLDLNEFTWERTRNGRLPYYLHGTGKHLYSVSTIATPIVVTPLYIVPAWLLAHYSIPYDDVRARLLIVVMERLSAATLTALSALVVFLTLDRLVARNWAIALTLIYGLGTSAWSISSQALWAHALAGLALSVLCWVFLTPEHRRLSFALAGLAGVAAAFAVANRPPVIVFAALAAVWIWRDNRARLFAFAAPPALGAAALLAYNISVFRTVAGGYEQLNQFSSTVLEGIAGLLVSPNRGLLTYTPVMIFAFAGAVRVWRKPAPEWMRLLVIGLGLHVLIYGGFSEWWAGYTFGPRYFCDVLPALVLLLVYGLVPLWRRPVWRAVAVVLIAYGVAVQAIGVYFADDDWNRHPVPLEVQPRRVWDWSDLQIARAMASGFKGTELAPLLAGVVRDPRPVPLAPLKPKDLVAEIESTDGVATMRPGSTRELVVRVTNRGDKPWPSFSGYGATYVRLIVVVVGRWLADGQPLAGMGDVASLPSNVAPGERAEVRLRLTAPPRPGVYEIDVRVVQALDGEHGVVGPDGLRFPMRVE
jgi:hypothetical protein